ncbi:MAG: homocitrate synthase [Candidatus Bipolaricaulia bacterium]
MNEHKPGRTIEILDTTLREGEQTANVSFSVDEKLEIARRLDEFGVDIIEAGHPVVSPDVREAVERIAHEGFRAQVLAHARAMRSDIDDALTAGTVWVGIFLGTSPLSLEHKLHISREVALEKIVDSICYAKDHGLKVRFTPEDATRTELDYLLEVVGRAEEAGADRISIADTVGTMHPTAMRVLVDQVVSQLSVPVHVHCHNDYGMAVANSLAGYEAGARLIDVTVNGLGERTGLASLAEVIIALKMLYHVENDWALEMLPELSHLVEKYSGVFNSDLAPIVGMSAFSHKAGLHTRAVLEDPRTYEAIPPEIVKRHRQIIIDKYTGRDTVRARLEEMGIKPTAAQLEEIVSRIKEKPVKRHFTDIDLLEIADDVLELDVRRRVPIKIEAIVAMALSSVSYTTRITRRVMAFDEVDQVYEIAGEYDLIAHVTADSIQDLNDIIEELRTTEGVNKTTTSLILKGYEYTQQDIG